jgi:hypothetical protein
MGRKLHAIGGALLLGVFVSTGAAAQDGDPAKMLEARAIVAAVMPPDRRDQMVEQVTEQLDGQFGGAMELEKIGDPGLVSLFGDYRRDLVSAMMPTIRQNLPKVAEAMAIAYTHEFSLAELKDIHAFAETPSGKHYLSRSSAIVGDPTYAAVNTAYIRELQEVAAPKISEFKAKVIAYLQAHPAVAKQIVASLKPQ